jgi:hypothetical protein
MVVSNFDWYSHTWIVRLFSVSLPQDSHNCIATKHLDRVQAFLGRRHVFRTTCASSPVPFDAVTLPANLSEAILDFFEFEIDQFGLDSDLLLRQLSGATLSRHIGHDEKLDGSVSFEQVAV